MRNTVERGISEKAWILVLFYVEIYQLIFNADALFRRWRQITEAYFYPRQHGQAYDFIYTAKQSVKKKHESVN